MKFSFIRRLGTISEAIEAKSYKRGIPDGITGMISVEPDMSFDVELIYNDEEIDQLRKADPDGDVAKTVPNPPKEYSGPTAFDDLEADILAGDSTSQELINHVAEYGPIGVLGKITRDEFKRLLKLIGHENARRMPQPKYWGGDRRAVGRNSDRNHYQKDNYKYIDSMISDNKEMIKNQVKLIFSPLPDEIKSAIFGEGDSNIKVRSDKIYKLKGGRVAGNPFLSRSINRAFDPSNFDLSKEMKNAISGEVIETSDELTPEQADKYEFDRYGENQGAEEYDVGDSKKRRVAQHLRKLAKLRKDKNERRALLDRAEEIEEQADTEQWRTLYFRVHVEDAASNFTKAVSSMFKKDQANVKLAKKEKNIYKWDKGIPGIRRFMRNMSVLNDHDADIIQDVFDMISLGIGADEYGPDREIEREYTVYNDNQMPIGKEMRKTKQASSGVQYIADATDDGSIYFIMSGSNEFGVSAEQSDVEDVKNESNEIEDIADRLI